MDSASEPKKLHPLLHRWFVEYNPIYLVSAMLVLGGMLVTSRGLAHEGSLYGFLGVAAIAELYACALIGGAALLVRIGQRRPAVMLGMLTILYQSDVTLHTETCANLGAIGTVAGVSWLALFGGKLLLLAWALRIRIARRTLATALVGALGLVALPHVIAHTEKAVASGAIAFFVFAIGSLTPRTPEEAVTSKVPLEAWGHTVLRRSVRVAWIMWGVLLSLHILFWSMQRPLSLVAIAPAIALVLVRNVRSELKVWLLVSAILTVVLVIAPRGFSPCALLAAITLAQRAFSRGHLTQTTVTTTSTSTPYRMPEEGEAAETVVASLVPVSAAERVRLFSGVLTLVYLSAWTFGFHGGELPPHLLPLDLAFGFGALLLAWRSRARLVLVPLGLTVTHGAWTSGLVPMPHSLVAQGGIAVGLGFVLLAGSLVTSYRLRHAIASAPERSGP